LKRRFLALARSLYVYGVESAAPSARDIALDPFFMPWPIFSVHDAKGRASAGRAGDITAAAAAEMMSRLNPLLERSMYFLFHVAYLPL
jgi:hypothetical protein